MAGALYGRRDTCGGDEVCRYCLGMCVSGLSLARLPVCGSNTSIVGSSEKVARRVGWECVFSRGKTAGKGYGAGIALTEISTPSSSALSMS